MPARTSLESSRPMMAPSVAGSARNSQRYSTVPSVSSHNALSHTFSSDSAQAEINTITSGLDKLENKKLVSQRYVPNQEKTDNLSKLALGAKLDRALGRRMQSQDAVMRPRTKTLEMSEKGMSEKSVAA